MKTHWKLLNTQQSICNSHNTDRSIFLPTFIYWTNVGIIYTDTTKKYTITDYKTEVLFWLYVNVYAVVLKPKYGLPIT